ncbi:MAG: glycosyltransferase, partial [Patescibacteria group bacterium]
AINKARGRWILMLDSDESIDKKLAREIQAAIKQNKYDGFIIPFQNHFLGRGLYYGGENYQMLRLFRKTKFKMEKAFVHEKVIINSRKIAVLKNKILHYSYRSIWQMYKKFTDYAIREAKQRRLNGESTSLKKIVMYPPHMFWARFIKDEGYRDGLFRIPLDLGFAYMEFLTYMTMLFLPKQNIK